MQHLQLYFVAGFAVLVIISTALFMMLRPAPEGGVSTWQAAGGFLPWGESTTLEETPATPYAGSGIDLAGGLPAPTLPLPNIAAQGTFDDLADLLAALVTPQGTTKASADFTPSSYAFIPKGLLSVGVAKQLSPEEAALHEYGDALGLSLASFGDLHPDMPQILKDQAEDRGNAFKGSAMKKLGDDFISFGAEVAAISSVPTAATSLNTQLAAAYKEVGENMKKIPDAQGDEAFLSAINTYNGSAENLSKRLVELVDLFQARSVTFSTSDPGNIFTFSANSSF